MINIHQIAANTAHDSTKLLLSSLENRAASDSVESIICKVLLAHSTTLLEKYHKVLKSELAQQGIDI